MKCVLSSIHTYLPGAGPLGAPFGYVVQSVVASAFSGKKRTFQGRRLLSLPKVRSSISHASGPTDFVMAPFLNVTQSFRPEIRPGIKRL